VSNKKSYRAIGPAEVTLLLVGVVAVALVFYLMNLRQNQQRIDEFSSQNHDITLAVAKAHTALEEKIGGDTSVNSIIDILDPLEETGILCQRVLQERGALFTANPGLRGSMKTACDTTTRVFNAAKTRLEQNHAPIGSVEEQEQDKVFADMTAAMDDVNMGRIALMQQYEQAASQASWFVVIIVLLGFLATPLLLWRARTAIDATSAVAEEGMVQQLSILDNGIDAVITIDENGVIETVNPVTERMFGYENGELIGQNVSLLMPPTHRDKHDGYIRQYVDNGKSDVIGASRELNARHKNGSVFPIEIGISQLLLGDNLLFTAIIRDLSKRKSTRGVLENQPAVMEMVSHMPGALLRINLDKLMSLDFASRGIEALTGFKMNDFSTKKIGLASLMADRQADILRTRLKNASSAMPLRESLSIKTASNQALQVSMHAVANNQQGQPVVFAYLSQERKSESAQTAVPQREARAGLNDVNAAQFAEYFPEPIMTVAMDGTVESINAAAEQFLFYKQAQISGKSVMLVLPAWRQLLPEQGAQRTGILSPYARTQLTDGRGKIINVDMALSRMVSGNHAHYYVNMRKADGNSVVQPMVAQPDSRQDAIIRALDQSESACFLTDREGAVIYVNTAFESLYQYKLDELFGQNINRINAGVHDDAFFKNMWSTLLMGDSFEAMVTNRAKKGNLVERAIHISPVRDSDHHISHFLATISAKTALKNAPKAASKPANQTAPDTDWREQTPVMYMEINADGMTVRKVNRAAEIHLGSVRGEIVSRSLNDLFPEAEAELLISAIKRCLDANTKQRYVESILEEAEGLRVFQIDATPRRDEKNRFTELEVIEIPVPQSRLEDLGATPKTVDSAVESESLFDAVTGLPAHSLFEDRFEQCIARVARNGKKVALLYFDLDKFETVNQSLGRAAGDILLRAIAERLQKCLRADSSMARMRDDEFAIVVSEIKDDQLVARIAQRLLNQLKKPYTIADHEITMTAGMGVAVFPADGENVSGLTLVAQQAVSLAKKTGSCRFRFGSKKKTDAAYEWLAIEKQLRTAINRQELEIMFQPQVELHSGLMVSSQILLSWHNTKLGDVPAARFLPVAESTNLTPLLHEWMLRQVAKVASRLSRGSGVRWALPLSALQFSDEESLNRWMQIAKDNQLSLENIAVLVDMKMFDEDIAVPWLQKVRKQGGQVILDNFGTQIQELSRLVRWPVDAVKLDESLIAELDKSQTISAISDIVSTARQMHMKVIAAGINQPSQLAELRRLQCDLGQGTAVSKPLAEKQLVQYISKDKQLELS